MINKVVWFRNDLRIEDNKALYFSVLDGFINVNICAIFIATPGQWIKHSVSDYQLSYLYKNLLKLKKNLYKYGIPLFYYECFDFLEQIFLIKDFCYRNKINEIFYNIQYELNEFRRDQKLEKILRGQVIVKKFHDCVFFAPGTILNKNNSMYKVYTPFRNLFVKKMKESNIFSFCFPKFFKQVNFNFFDVPKSFKYFYNKKISGLFPIGEKDALIKLKVFCENKIKFYSEKRNFFDIDSTSFLSPCFVVGLISPRQCLQILLKMYPNFLEKTDHFAFVWFNEIIWREFYKHLVFCYPFLCMNKPLIFWTDNINWNNNIVNFKAWRNGLTGYPIVDAAMRQLNKVGWIHNRLRMISASFLTKNLLIDWRLGESHFMSKLIDGDFSSNNGGWQWSSSVGTDSCSYFRVFNPILQGKKYDPFGKFVKSWIPELINVPYQYIHDPYVFFKERSNFSVNYPEKIVDYGSSKINFYKEFIKAKKS